ncbi:DUF6310 domain-containing protein [Corallococcus sp. EGB]|uniref:DUF6310 domain-containing protein n=1 Tax=Corallococcus sp. EGB TaxID=1521117 RepID=UPI001CBFEBA1|nr:DUF6310 domain-containing protein [Corallococcus sp. EGB]
MPEEAGAIGARKPWEIKTHEFDSYNDFVREQEIRKEVKQLKQERDVATACGDDFVPCSMSSSLDATDDRAKQTHTHHLCACARGQRQPHAQRHPWD